MRNILLILLVLLSMSKATVAQEAAQSHKDSLNQTIDQYYKLNLKVFGQNSIIDDIDEIFKLFTNDFEYVHPKYGGTYSRKDLYDGYCNNQKNGRYDGNIIDVLISNKILGLNAVTVEKQFIHKDATKGDPEMTLFEFRDGKISRIYEYW